MKDSFVLFTELVDSVQGLSDEQAGALFKMILNYEAERDLYEGLDDIPTESLVAFSFIQRQLDKMDEKYQETIEKRKKAGQAGANARWQNMANAYDGIANDSKRINRNAVECDEIAKMADTDTVTDNDTVSPTEIKKEKRKRFTPPTIEEVTVYCQERNNGINPDSFIDFYTSKGWKVGNQPMKDWKAAVRTWEKRDKGQGRASPDKFDATQYLLDKIAKGDYDDTIRDG